MKVFMGLVMLFLPAMFMGAVESSQSVFSYKDVKYSEKRPDGNFNIICEDGSQEFNVPLAAIIKGRICTGGYLSLGKKNYRVGDDIEVNASNLPGSWNDWVGIYFYGDSHEDYVDYYYTLGRQVGSFRFYDLPAGHYQARLFYNDSYKMVHEVSFVIR